MQLTSLTIALAAIASSVLAAPVQNEVEVHNHGPRQELQRETNYL